MLTVVAVTANTTNNLVFIVITVGATLFTAVTAPLLLLFLTARANRKSKAEDYARQDAVVEAAQKANDQIAKAANLVAEKLLEHQKQDRAANRVVTDRLIASDERAAAAAASTDEQLGVIHKLVNSQMTSALQAELDATIREATLMHELSAIKEANGLAPSPGAITAMAVAEAKIAELRITIAARKAIDDRS